MSLNKGYVYIVGCGPYDYGLITLKAIECIKKADVIIYDRLINEKYLLLAKSNCEIIYAGKEQSFHTLSQHEINNLMVLKAKEGKVVVRLKGGDPYIFGRGGEEAYELYLNNIPFEVVPGVSALSSVPAYGGVPITYRGISSAFAVVTGHEDPNKGFSDINWNALAKFKTLIFFMTVKNLSFICQKLIDEGMKIDTKAMIIENGTTPFQKTFISTIGELALKSTQFNFNPPSLLVIGEVVKFNSYLNWFEKLPLFGKKIVVTRSTEQIFDLSYKLTNGGALVYEVPTIAFAIPSDNFNSLNIALNKISEYELVIFTSINGVTRFFEYIKQQNKDARIFAKCKIAAIGEKTKEALLKFGILTDIIPQKYIAEELANEIINTYKNKKIKVLIIRSENARTTLVDILSNFGYEVDIANMYKTIKGDFKKEYLHDLLLNNQIDLITFTSSSTFENFINEIDISLIHNLIKSNKLKIASIGPITTKTCQKYNIDVHIEATKHTIDGLVQKIYEYYLNNK